MQLMSRKLDAKRDRVELLGLTRSELTALVTNCGFGERPAARLWRYVYRDGVESPDKMPALPQELRQRLAGTCTFGDLRVERETHCDDGFTRKYLFALTDGRQIETVLMRFKGRVTACISSQAGCAMGCVFCATGQMGFQRHLSAGEMVSQALFVDAVLRNFDTLARKPGRGTRTERLRNVVLMGMGEPLHNYDAVFKAIDILRDGSGLAISPRHITLSTVGVIPGIIRLADEALPVRLAVSLHATTQAEREALIPVARAWPLSDLLEACRYYAARLDRRIFFEWALIAGTNDSPEIAHALGRLLRDIPSHVNLIRLNPTPGYTGVPSDEVSARQFQAILAEYGHPSTIRQRRGIDIAAGCGQLATP